MSGADMARSDAVVRDRSLDALKGIAISMVLLLHLGIVRFVDATHGIAGTGRGPVGIALSFALGMTYRTVLQLAVPVFLLVSLSLYVCRSRGRSAYFTKRIWRIGQLLLFWLAVQYALFVVFVRRVPPLDFETLRLGGPSLAAGGHGTVLYFLVDLIVLIAVTEVGIVLSTRYGTNVFTAFAWTLILLPMVWFATGPAIGNRVDYFSVLNFLPYAGIALLVNGDLRRLGRRFWWWVLAFVLFSAVDGVEAVTIRGWSLETLSDYGRVSIVFGSLVLVVLVLRYVKPTAPLVWLGEYSLGIFVLHANYQTFTGSFIHFSEFPTALGTIRVNILAAIATVALTLATVWLLAKTPLRRFVR